jgi:hypothetical protein
MDIPSVPAQSSNRATGLESIRRNFGLMSPQQKEEVLVLEKAQRLFEYFSKAKRKWEYESWLNDQFYQGEQNIAFNRTLGNITRVKNLDTDKVVINKIKQNARYVVMWLNRDHPQFRVLPGDMDDSSYDRAKKEEHYIDYLYDRLELNKKNKQTTLDGYKYKIGFQKIFWDQDAIAPTSPYTPTGSLLSTSNSKGEVSIERVDPFELYWDPLMQDIESSRGFIHALPRTLGEIRNNPNYMNTQLVTADQKMAASYIKEAQLRFQTAGALSQMPSGNDDMATAIIREYFWKEWSAKSNKFIVRKVVTTTGGVLLQDTTWPMDFYPYEDFLADVTGSTLDGGSPIRDLRSPQKALNQINTTIQTNANIMGKINWRIPRGSNVNVITDEVGQFLEFDPTPGGAPEQITPSGLPAYIADHRQALAGYIDDLGGNHSASYGKSPGSKASGELVNKLQEGDSNNLTLMRDNLDDFERRVGKKALLTFKTNASVERMVRSKTTNAFGKHDLIKLKPEEVGTDDDVQVVTGNSMPYSMQDKQEMFLNMYKEKIIDAPTFIKAVNMPDLDNAMSNSQLDIERALGENKMLIIGKVPDTPARQEDHQVHLQVHTQLVKSPEYLAATPKIQDAIDQHIVAHINLSYELSQISNSLNVEAIKRSESYMVRTDSIDALTPNEATQYMSKFGIQSDRAEIVARGGLTVQDPTTAEQQAQGEDMNMMNGKPCAVSPWDNHQVHIETHTQLMATAAWPTVPDVIKTLVTSHVNDHITALQTFNPMPGLMARPGYDSPVNAQVFPAKPGANGPAKANPKQPPVVAGGQRPLMPHEHVQPKGAVDNQLAKEAAMQKEESAQEVSPIKAGPQPPKVAKAAKPKKTKTKSVT